MVITKNGFIDLGNNLFINKDLVKYYDDKTNTAYLYNGETYRHGEFLNGGTYSEQLFDSKKGDIEYFRKRGKDNGQKDKKRH